MLDSIYNIWLCVITMLDSLYNIWLCVVFQSFSDVIRPCLVESHHLRQLVSAAVAVSSLSTTHTSVRYSTHTYVRHTTHTYVRYAKRPDVWPYWLVIIVFLGRSDVRNQRPRSNCLFDNNTLPLSDFDLWHFLLLHITVLQLCLCWIINWIVTPVTATDHTSNW